MSDVAHNRIKTYTYNIPSYFGCIYKQCWGPSRKPSARRPSAVGIQVSVTENSDPLLIPDKDLSRSVQLLTCSPFRVYGDAKQWLSSRSSLCAATAGSFLRTFILTILRVISHCVTYTSHQQKHVFRTSPNLASSMCILTKIHQLTTTNLNSFFVSTIFATAFQPSGTVQKIPTLDEPTKQRKQEMLNMKIAKIKILHHSRTTVKSQNVGQPVRYFCNESRAPVVALWGRNDSRKQAWRVFDGGTWLLACRPSLGAFIPTSQCSAQHPSVGLDESRGANSGRLPEGLPRQPRRRRAR